jgi:hypothetical protein
MHRIFLHPLSLILVVKNTHTQRLVSIHVYISTIQTSCPVQAGKIRKARKRAGQRIHNSVIILHRNLMPFGQSLENIYTENPR